MNVVLSLSNITLVDISWCLSRLACRNCPLGSPTQSASRYADNQVGTSAAKHVELDWGVSRFGPLTGKWKKNTQEWTTKICVYILITNLIHWLLFIRKIIFYSTCFEPQVLIFRRIQLYTCSIWYCHSLWEFLVACRYTAWVRTVYRQATRNCDSTICCMYTTVSSWRWALDARNM